jgi:hypothetical protein
MSDHPEPVGSSSALEGESDHARGSVSSPRSPLPRRGSRAVVDPVVVGCEDVQGADQPSGCERRLPCGGVGRHARSLTTPFGVDPVVCAALAGASAADDGHARARSRGARPPARHQASVGDAAGRGTRGRSQRASTGATHTPPPRESERGSEVLVIATGRLAIRSRAPRRCGASSKRL